MGPYIFNQESAVKLTPFCQLTFICAVLSLISCVLIAPHVNADIVQAEYEIIVSDFLHSNNGGPAPPTSNQLSGTVTFTYNTAIVEQFELVPDAVTGFNMTDNSGHAITYDAQNSGINTLTNENVTGGDHRITFGGLPSVASMTGLSEDMRITFDISSVDFTVSEVYRPFVFVTTADPFYTAQNNSVELISVSVFPDADSDGFPDAIDNCLLVSNSDQRDTNGDNIGNACDPDFNQDCIVNFIDLATFGNNFLLPGDLDTDLNGDGVTNFVDLVVLTDRIFEAPGPSGLSNSCSV